MARTDTSKRIREAGNPFMGMTMAQMKKKWSSMTPQQRAANVKNFRDAAAKAPKAKTVTKPPAKPQTKPQTPSKPESKPQQKPSRGSRRPPRAGSGTKINVGKAVKNFAKAVDKKLKLTHKKGDVKKVGRSTFMWNGKRWEKQNRPF